MKTIERLMVEVAAVAATVLCIIIVANVILRTFFQSDFPDAIIFVRDLMIPTILLPLAMATANRGHVAVTFASDMMSARTRGWLIVGGSVFALIALVPLIYAGWRETSINWASGEHYGGDLNLPRWPSRLLFLLGIAAMWVQLWINLATDLRQMRAFGRLDEDRHGGGH